MTNNDELLVDVLRAAGRWRGRARCNHEQLYPTRQDGTVT
jgi:hypothetical protein